MTEKSGLEPIYPSSPLEAVVTQEQQESLLQKTAPPTYEQSLAGDAATAAGTATAAQAGGLPMPPQPVSNAANVSVVILPHTGIPLGPAPMDVLCPFCSNYARTRLRFEPNSRTHTFALLLCLFQLYCCMCLPYCIPSCMNANHYCGMCDRLLGTYTSV